MTERIRSPYNNQAVSFKLLHHFVVVCEASSLSRAAHVLNVCQSNLTLQMSDLERRMGAADALIPEGSELTEAGQILCPKPAASCAALRRSRYRFNRRTCTGASIWRAPLCGADYPAVPQAARMPCRNDARFEVKLVEMPSSNRSRWRTAGAGVCRQLPNIQPGGQAARVPTALLACAGRMTRWVDRQEPPGPGGEVFWMVDRVVEPVLPRDHPCIAGCGCTDRDDAVGRRLERRLPR